MRIHGKLDIFEGAGLVLCIFSRGKDSSYLIPKSYFKFTWTLSPFVTFGNQSFNHSSAVY